MKFGAHIERWPTRQPFRITDTTWTEFVSVVVEVSADGCVGRGEALGVYYLQETASSLLSEIDTVADAIRSGIDRTALQKLLPPGGARNAIDCALWDLEAKRAGTTVWELTRIAPKSLETVFTIGLEPTPQQMAAKASAASGQPLLKIKLNDDRPLERMQAVRAARPDARIVVDANQAWSPAGLRLLAPELSKLGVELIEQPLARGSDVELEGFRSPVPLCADESCLHLGELAQAARRYQFINIKLDKAGGLTHALKLTRAARELGMGLMVGCMGGSSLAMAPAFVVGCLCDFVDIDGPLLQKSDRLPGLDYKDGRVAVFDPGLWG